MDDGVQRCLWARQDPLLAHYHDHEWGVPERNSRALWEKLMLDGMQAGLSWRTILHKRQSLRRAFANFEPASVANFDGDKVAALLVDASIIRSRSKIIATINNAKAYLRMQQAGEDFSDFCWQAVGNRTVRQPIGRFESLTQTPLSVALAKSLRSRGFSFVGPTIVYAWLQATGLIDDHEPGCFRCVI